MPNFEVFNTPMIRGGGRKHWDKVKKAQIPIPKTPYIFCKSHQVPVKFVHNCNCIKCPAKDKIVH